MNKILIQSQYKTIIKFYILGIIIASISFIEVSCKNPTDSSDYDDLDISVISVRTISMHLNPDLGSVKKAKIYFTIENIGSKSINGWKVYFNVHTTNSGQFIASQKKYYALSEGEISPVQIIIAQIPQGYGNAVRTSLKRIQTW